MDTQHTRNIDSTFLTLLQQAPSDRLKKMVKAWGGGSIIRKEECISYLFTAMRSIERLRQILDACNPFEQAALALIKSERFYDETTTIALCAATLGLPVPKLKEDHLASISPLLESLFDKGLLFIESRGGYSPSIYYAYGRNAALEFIVNPVVVSEIKPLNTRQFQELNVSAAPKPETTYVRRPQTVALGHSAFLHALEAAGDLKVTKSGEQRLTSAVVTKLNKVLEKQGWFNMSATMPGSEYDALPIEFYLDVMPDMGLLEFDHASHTYRLTEPPDTFMQQDFVSQTQQWLVGLARTRTWAEIVVGQHGYFHYTVMLRNALMVALTLLPSHEFIPVDALSDALFERIGERFSLTYRQPRPNPRTYGGPNRTPEQFQAELREWQTKVKHDWQANERAWIRSALSSWAYGLGLVELGLTDNIATSFRLTELGRAALDFTQDEEASGASKGILLGSERRPGVWVVQPNFDVLVYLERTTSQQLGLIERFAERVQVDQHIAHYRLTRRSIYEALERGGTLDTLVTELSAGSTSPLPQNVLRELQGWAAMRDQLTLIPLARVIEYPTAEARDEAIAQGQGGQPVGERFVIVDNKTRLKPQSFSLVDYARPLPACLTMNEEGIVTLDPSTRDLLIDGQLSAWAERVDALHWRLSQASVSGALKRGSTLPQFTESIQSRLKSKMPPLLQLAINNWAGMAKRVEVEPVIAIRCQTADVMRAIAGSVTFKKLLRGTIAENIALVDPAHVDEFNAALRKIGIEPKNFDQA